MFKIKILISPRELTPKYLEEIIKIKKLITKDFDKSCFALEDHNDSNNDGQWEAVDPYIREFVKEINLSEDISTKFSCEGHGVGEHAYLFFAVNKKGYDIFWENVLPELSYELRPKVNKKVHETALYSLSWNFMLLDNGISINLILDSEYLNWREQRRIFWKSVFKIFRKYYGKR